MPRLLLAVLPLLFLAPMAASGQGPTSSGAVDFLKRAQARIDRIVADDPGSASGQEALRRAARELIDFDELARRAMAGHWEDLDAQQRRRFLAAMNALVETAWTGRAAEQADFDVEYLGHEPLEGDDALVQTILVAGEARIPVDYRLHHGQEGWHVVDIVTDEVSLVSSYQGQFNRIMKTRGFDGLLSTLENKVAELRRAAGSRS